MSEKTGRMTIAELKAAITSLCDRIDLLVQEINKVEVTEREKISGIPEKLREILDEARCISRSLDAETLTVSPALESVTKSLRSKLCVLRVIAQLYKQASLVTSCEIRQACIGYHLGVITLAEYHHLLETLGNP